MTPQQLYDSGLRLHQAGRLNEAADLYRQALAIVPRHADALHMLGVVMSQVNQHEPAIALLSQAAQLRPGDPAFQCDLGNALFRARRLEESAAVSRLAVQLKPDYPVAHGNLANALKELNQWDQAITHYVQAISLAPRFADALFNLGSIYQRQGKLEEAEALLRRAVEAAPAFHEAWCTLGSIVRERGNLVEAEGLYRRAIALRPDFAFAYNNLANTLRDLDRLPEAMAAMEAALQRLPNEAGICANYGGLLKDQGRMDEAIQLLVRAAQLDLNNPAVLSNLLYFLHFHPDYDGKALFRQHQLYEDRFGRPQKEQIRPHLNNRDPDRRLRIGYVSGDFYNHPVGRFMAPLLEHHDPRQVEVFAYSGRRVGDAFTQRLAARCHAWRNTVGLGHDQLAELIRADGVDILVDLSMHMASNRLPVFARKPAPVQVTYLAYASTTGLSAIDYRLTDPFIDPPDSPNLQWYAEKSVWLKETYWAYEPLPEATAPLGPLPMASRGYVTFGNLNNFCKASVPALKAWVDLLERVENSRLILHARQGDGRTRLLNYATARGIDPARISFAGFLPAAEYFALHQEIDIALDPFPYTGGATTCDALWMGAPVVTLAGRTAVGRSGVSLLTNVGLPELIAPDVAAYIDLAAGLARDPSRLAELRAGMRERMQASPIMKPERFAREVEQAFRTMWRQGPR